MLANNSYTRPAPAAVLPDTRWPPRCASCAEQVHLALGGPGEKVVSFATAQQGASAVEWWREGGGGGGRAVGTPAAYSQLIYVDEWLSHPPMGAPRVPEDHLLALQDTSAWAYDRATGRRFANYMKPKALAYGLGAYNNPQMYYDSPAIHRVSLRNLRPGARYGYRVAGDARNFSFTMPPDAADGAAAYPLTLGLTADLGQTAVSEANTRLLLAAQKHGTSGGGGGGGGGGVVLLAGDLSYADGYPWRWDTFGRMLEPLAARVPVMTAGGNHDVDLGEAWLAYNTRCRRGQPRHSSPARNSPASNSLSSLLPPSAGTRCRTRRRARPPTFGGPPTSARAAWSRCVRTAPPPPARCSSRGSRRSSLPSTAAARRGSW